MDTTTHGTLRAANAARHQEWDTEGQITMAYRGNELAGEVGEACNVIKKLERERMGIRGSRATVEQLAEELADIIICTDLIAMGAGIDLDAAVAAKFNATSEKVGLRTRLAPEAEIANLRKELAFWTNRDNHRRPTIAEARAKYGKDPTVAFRCGSIVFDAGLGHALSPVELKLMEYSLAATRSARP